jgi:phage terminase Nu1 subunit (DNA packaging protein)
VTDFTYQKQTKVRWGRLAKPKQDTEVPLTEKEVITSELATIVGKTPQWIRQLTRDGTLKQSARGKYILGDAVQAYIEHVSGGKEEDKKPRYIDHKTEHERIKAERAALELARMRGELHAAEDVEAVMNDMLTAFRQKILAIPNKLAPQLVGIDDIGKVKAVLTKDLHEALAELSNYDPEMFKDVGADTDDAS